ncbi:hypothetical protein LTR02_002070 [Friedmanniomyces endolithicus]|nr:hypothetical protein LTR38_004556 [Friedmanniomyces endolithicus]KAK0811816.1 hypothetical protein LTR59_001754 [Friedmanniomyces endolithicus]KAK0821505.1 hypothetical protein LTR75_000591 [Friedmanniomyces endolithicus]KAK0830639.1 hypothetical protein LTR03_015810 [Friedmanniomyces endolithicus]KAK0863381.1 hypothetical protein LTS02_006595 [Friedmanniomyces endolithicus]
MRAAPALISICSLFNTATAFSILAPFPTEPTLDTPDSQGWTPMPTRAPELPHGDLFKRGFTTLCGYVNGVSTNSLDCGTAICGFNTGSSAFGCCTQTYVSNSNTYLTDCAFYTSCRDYTDGCDAACQSNTAVEFCSSDYPYCALLTISSSFSNYLCAPVFAGTAPLPVLGTWTTGANLTTESAPPVIAPTTPTSSSSIVASTTTFSSYSTSSSPASSLTVTSPSPTPFSQSQQFGYATGSSTAASTSSKSSSGSDVVVADSVFSLICLTAVSIGALAFVL